MINKLPPLHAVHVFETVARLGGVRSAAEELCVTPPAVSHQLAKLEAHLESPLFVRRGRKLILTETGRDYLIEIGPGLEAIGRATTVAARRSLRETLTIAAPPTLTALWLIPRLQEFWQLYPHFDVRLLDRMTFDPAERGIDVAIEYRFEPDPDLVSHQILTDELVPLATPEFAQKHDLSNIGKLRGLTLIETERRLTSWRSILADFDWSKKQTYLSVSYSLHAFEAAALGLGVALGNRANAEDMLASGKLCIPFELDETTMPSPPRYYVSTLAHQRRVPRVQAFLGWLNRILSET